MSEHQAAAIDEAQHKKDRSTKEGGEIPLQLCPHCGHGAECATPADDSAQRPEVGDSVVCIECGGFSVYVKGFTLRCMTAAEFSELPTELQGNMRSAAIRIHILNLDLLRKKLKTQSSNGDNAR